MTRNQDLNVLHVDDAAAFVDGLTWRVITGDTLLFDFVYFLHPVRIPTILVAKSEASMRASQMHCGTHAPCVGSSIGVWSQMHTDIAVSHCTTNEFCVCAACRPPSGTGQRRCSRCSPSCAVSRASRGRPSSLCSCTSSGCGICSYSVLAACHNSSRHAGGCTEAHCSNACTHICQRKLE